MAWSIKFVEVFEKERIPMSIHPFHSKEEAQSWWKNRGMLFNVDSMVLFSELKE